MKLAPKVVLITPGALSRTQFARLPQIRRIVTHVVAPSYREASRTANSMRTPHACRSLEEAAGAEAYLVCDETQADHLLHMRHQPDATFVFAFDHPQACVPRFRARALPTAILTVMDEVVPPKIFVQAVPEVVKQVRRLFHRAGLGVTTVATGSPAHIAAARLLLGPVLLSLSEAASRHLRHAGLELDEVRDIVGGLAVETLRTHQRSGSRTWRGNEAITERVVADVAATDYPLSLYLRAAEAASRGLMSRSAGKAKAATAGLSSVAGAS